MRTFCILVIGCLWAMPVEAQVEEFFRKDYSDYWIVYDPGADDYVPFLTDEGKLKTIHFFLDLKANEGRQFELCNTARISVFVNGDVVETIDHPGCTLYSTDSLYRQYRVDSLQFSIYKVDDWADIQTSILYPALGFVPPESPLMLRSQSSTSNFMVVALLLIAIVMIISRESNPKFFQEFSSIAKTFALRVRASQLYLLKPFSREIVLMLILHSLAISFLVISVGDSIPGLSDLLDTSNLLFWGKVGYWLVLSASMVVISYLQYLLLSVVNVFFNNPKILPIQFYDSLRINHFYFGLIFLLIALTYALSTNLFLWLISVLWVVIIGLYILKSMFIYMKMLNQSSHRKMHIFSYFCATEILPVALVVKVIFI